LRKYFNDKLAKETLVVQQYINTRTLEGNPFDIRVHMMKDRNNDWEFVKIRPRIGYLYAVISPLDNGGYGSDLYGFLKRNFPKHHTLNIEKQIKNSSKKIAQSFSTLYEENFNEIAFDFAINEDAIPYFIEANI